AKAGNRTRRAQAGTGFVASAREELRPTGGGVGTDILGYARAREGTPGSGQDLAKSSPSVDVISSMLAPSHWTTPYRDVPLPEKEPYRVVTEYAKVEQEVLGELDDPPVSRPWSQDFEAPWLYDGPAKKYGKKEVEAQIKALNENGIDEFLIWNPSNSYTENVDYTPLD